MRNLAILFLIISFSLTSLAQTPKKNNFGKNDKNTSSPKIGDEKTEFEKAIGETDATTRISALQNFLKNFPNTEQKNRVLGLIVSGRAEIAEVKLQNFETEEAVKLFKLAVKEVPQPVSDELFSRVLMQIPSSLFFRGERKSAYEISDLIEEKIGDNAKQLIGLSAFFISVENGLDAVRVLNKSIEKDPNSSVAYQTLGLAHRMNFDLELSIEANQKSLELDSESIPAKRSLAEMKRATGKTDEALKLYEEILAKDSSDWNAKTGLILSMFDAGKAVEAELQMRNFLVENPNNLPLLVGAAYYFAANGDGTQAIDYSQKALAVEPRYVWAYITLAKGFVLQGEPLLAERSLLTAKQYGNFPTLQYELAKARIAAGFYRDAADELKTSFSVKDGLIKTSIGGRFAIEANNFTELLGLERQASIFQPNAADDAVKAEKLKNLLNFVQNLEAENADETNLIAAADEFIKGDDQMKTHRQIFVANQLLEKQKALPKVLEITKDAVKGVDAALDVKNSSSAVLADEIYEPRKLATAKGETLLVPELPRQTLAAILRGRIEEISGWALFRQEKNDEALLRMKRAISVFPKDSAWSRLTFWQMGMILEREGENEEALDNYIKGYLPEEKDEVKKIVIESLYKRMYGSLDGLKERLEAKPEETNVASIFTKKTEPKVEKTPETKVEKPSEEVPSENDEIEKLPEDLNLNIKLKPLENPTPTSEETVLVEDEKTETVNEKVEIVSDENKSETETPEISVEPKVKTVVSDDETKTDEIKNDTETVSEKPTESNDSEKEIEKPKPVGKPVLIIEDKLTNTRTESTIGDETVDKMPADEKVEEKTVEPTEVKKIEDEVKEVETDISDSEKTSDETTKTDETISTEVPTKTEVEEVKTDENPENKTISPTENIVSTENPTTNRPRIVSEDKIKNISDETSLCEIVINQEVVSFINNGGSMDVLVVIANDAEGTEIKAVSSSPEDVEAVFQPEIGEAKGRAFFIIRSISTKTGEFKVTFETPCGNKEILVKVR